MSLSEPQLGLARSVISIVHDRKELEDLMAWATLRRMEGGDERALDAIVELIQDRAVRLGVQL